MFMPQPFVYRNFYTLRLGSIIPVFLATPVGVSDAPEPLRTILVVPPVLLEPEGVRVLVVEVLGVMCVPDVFGLSVGILLVE